MLSRIGIILIIFYIASFSLSGQVAAIDYSLPYPGNILPDSPLYIFKIIQEKLTLTLAGRSEQKALYLLFLSDKKLAAAEKLVAKGKKTIGVTTIQISEEYFANGLKEALRVREKQKDTFDLWAKFTVSASKHQEIISKIANLVKDNESEQIEKARRKSQQLQSRVKEILYEMAQSSKK